MKQKTHINIQIKIKQVKDNYKFEVIYSNFGNLVIFESSNSSIGLLFDELAVSPISCCDKNTSNSFAFNGGCIPTSGVASLDILSNMFSKSSSSLTAPMPSLLSHFTSIFFSVVTEEIVEICWADFVAPSFGAYAEGLLIPGKVEGLGGTRADVVVGVAGSDAIAGAPVAARE